MFDYCTLISSRKISYFQNLSASLIPVMVHYFVNYRFLKTKICFEKISSTHFYQKTFMSPFLRNNMLRSITNYLVTKYNELPRLFKFYRYLENLADQGHGK